MKILFVTSSLYYGGAEKMLAFVANGLSQKKHKVYIANLLEEKDQVQRLDSNIQIEPIHSSGTRYIEKIEIIRGLRKYIKKNNPDVIIAFKSTPTWMTCLANTRMKTPIVFSERGDPYVEKLKSLRTYLYWNLINNCDGAVFQTEGARRYFEKGLQRRSAVIPNPIAKADYINSIGEEKAIVSFGRLDNHQKRYDIMIDAFGHFYHTHKDYKLKLYGTGEDEQQIKQWVYEKNLQNAVEFLGYAGSPQKKLKKGNIFLITSDYEGISNAMLEAMAAGFPVVSTDSSPGGARMVIQNEENGLLVPTGNSEQIAIALSKLADNDYLRKKCAMKAKEVSIRFASDKILDQWEEYLLKVVSNQKK